MRGRPAEASRDPHPGVAPADAGRGFTAVIGYECSIAPVHHWRIDEAIAPLSSGTCKHCGTVREFKNERRPGQLSLATDSDPGGPGRARLPVVAFRA